MNEISADASSPDSRSRKLGFVFKLTPRKKGITSGLVYNLTPRERGAGAGSWAAPPYWSLDRALYAFLIATLLWPYTMGWQMGPLLWGPSRILFVVLIITFISFWVKGGVRLQATPLDLALLIFFGAMLASLAFNSNNMTPGQFNIGLKTVGNSAVEWFVLYYIVTSVPGDFSKIRRFLAVITGLIVIVAVVGVIEYFIGFRIFEWLRPHIPGGANMESNLHEPYLQAGTYSVIRGGITRIISTTISFQEVGTLMAMTIPFLLYLLAYAKSQRQVVAWIVGLGFVSSALLLSVTRGAMLAAVVAVAFQSLFSRKGILRSGVVIGAAAVILAFIFFPKLVGAVSSVTSPEILPQEQNVQVRLNDWPYAAKMIENNELLGVGPGLVLRQQLGYGTEDIPFSFAVLDNYYLAVAVESGLLGVGSLLIIWGAIAWVLLRRRRLPPPIGSEIQDLRAAFFSSALAFMVLCLTFDAMGLMTLSKFFWVIVGLGVALARIEQKMAREAAGS